MGNNNTNTTPDYGDPYLTSEGELIYLEGYDPDFIDGLDDKISDWLWGSKKSIIHEMDVEEINYLIKHLQDSKDDPDIDNNQLTRVESDTHFLSSGLKVGDTLSGNGLFRSFSKSNDSSLDVIEAKSKYWSNGGGWVIYRTVGNTPFFDPTVFRNPFPGQTEVFVPVDSMKVEAIHEFGWNYKEVSKLMKWDSVPDINEAVTVVDISYDPSVKSVTTKKGTVSTEPISNHEYHKPRNAEE